MQRTRIKICGIRDAATAAAAVEAGADAIGLVFVPGSPRCVTLDQARQVVQELPAFVEPVGLFVDAPASEIIQTCAEVGLRTVQLHGKETPQFAAGLAALRVIKAFAFHGAGIAEQLVPWSGPRNFVGMLLDTPAEGKELPGGSGRAFKWADLAELKQTGALPGWASLILAGGLHPENVSKAVSLLAPYAVDVSSGVESQRGVKDMGKIRAFCRAVQSADAAST